MGRLLGGQVPCKLCGVSFNIGRVRRPSEPLSTGWNPLYGEPAALPDDWDKGQHQDNFISKDFVTWRRCGDSTGCQDVKREAVSIDSTTKASGDTGLDDENDGDYVQESEEDYEPLEDASEVASVEDVSMGDAESSFNESDDVLPTQLVREIGDDSKKVDTDTSASTNEIDELKSGTEDQQRRPSIDGTSRSSPPVVEAGSASISGNSEMTDWNDCQELEHLAGPGCEHSSGYCGFNTSAEEMRGSTTVQCLVTKTPEWTPESEDQEFERSGKYFLSGLCGQMPSRDMDGPTMTPPRHGADHIWADVVFWEGAEAEESRTSMPFHPTCFEIFSRVSRLRTASIDVVGLMGWRRLESDYRTDRSFPHHEAVKSSSEQWWHHRRGDEWLAANPVVVPGLAALLRQSVKGNNTPCEGSAHETPSSEYPFSKLPREIADAILELLNPVDVAALRLAGYARFLTVESWYQQLRQGMPWLWEVWDTVLPSFWATTTVSALAAEKKRKEKADRRIMAARNIIEDEIPEALENWEIENAKRGSGSYAACGDPGLRETTVLPKDETDWCRIYYDVRMNWEALKGLQNRERIWKDIEEIFRRIDKYRSEGRIP